MSEIDNNQDVHNQNSQPDQLQECKNELAQWKERSLRISADFENYKKRVEREKDQWIRMAQSNILFDLLSIADDFDRALNEARKSGSDQLKVWIEGFELTKKSLDKLLAKYDVQEVKETVKFNPELHEAVMHVESPDHKSGDVVTVLQKGYVFKGHVLRPAKVSVAQ
jgi:molecular chaperone GrpE